MALTDVYYNKPWAPAQQVQEQQTAAFGSLPRLAQEKMQMDAAQAETDRQNRPMTPWEEAALKIKMDHVTVEHIPQIAAELKAKLAQGGGDPQGGAMPQQQGQAQDMTGMQQPQMQPSSGLTPATGADAQPTRVAPNMPRSLSDTRMQQPKDMYANMSHRDYTEHMSELGNIAKIKSDRDYLEEQKLKNKGNLDVAKVRSASEEKRAELQRRVKEKILDEKTAHDIAEEKHWDDQIQAKLSMAKEARDTNERIKILHEVVSMSNNAANNSARIIGSLTGLARMGNEDVLAEAEKNKKTREEMGKQAQELLDELMKAPPSKTNTSKVNMTAPTGTGGAAAAGSVNRSAQSAPRKFTVGQKVKQGGEEKIVKEVDANGKIVSLE